MDVEAVEAADPVGEEATAAHAFLVGDVVDWRGAIGHAGGLDVDDFLAGRDGVGDVGLADAVEVGLLRVGLPETSDRRRYMFGIYLGRAVHHSRRDERC